MMATARGDTNKPLKRPLVSCLVPNCGAKVTRLSQHMVRVHKIKTEKCIQAPIVPSHQEAEDITSIPDADHVSIIFNTY